MMGLAITTKTSFAEYLDFPIPLYYEIRDAAVEVLQEMRNG